MARVAVCEDDAAIRGVLIKALRHAGHTPISAHTGAEAMRIFSDDADIDVLVLDIGLPDADGRDVCQALRSAGQQAPVLFLTALDGVHDRLSGFSVGADDYVSKPFDVRELLARIEAVARRRRGQDEAGQPLVLDPARHAIRSESGEVLLTPTEYRMLAVLTSQPGDVIRRRAVVAAAWPDGAIVRENTIDTNIRRIRAKLAAIDSPVTIKTVRGVGFKLA